MPVFIFKEAPDVDYYVAWSSIVEAPAVRGNREEMLAYLRRESDPYLREDAPHHPDRRMERCDATGTSSLWVTKASEESPSFAAHGHPEEGSWADDTYIYRQQGVLTRQALFELCHRLDEDDEMDVSDLLKPFDSDGVEE